MTHGLAARFPVSIKGVVEQDGLFVLLKNERDEWELPGGKLEPGEAIEDCLVREIGEELNLPVAVGRPLNNWVYFVNGEELRSFPLQEIAGLRMPDGYKRSIALHAEN